MCGDEPVSTRRVWHTARGEWVDELGRRWPWVLVALVALVAVAGVLAPLADPDLAIHLATGEWVVHHRSVPLREPFAWTRSGESFYAYSWAIEVLYFAIWRAVGPAGLQALHGALLVLAVASVALLGRVLGWRPWTVLLVATAHLALALGVAPFLRPQLLLFILLPLAWAQATIAWRALVITAPDGRSSLVGLALIGCIAANTHLLFPLTALPVGLIALTAPTWRPKRAAVVLGAVAGGWLVSPYALVWPQMFQQNLGGNVLLAFPSAIAEYRPGFTMLWSGTGAIVVLILVVLPWILPTGGEAPLSSRERLWYGLAWVVGLLAFAMATRAVLIWWVALLPLVGRVVDRLPRPAPAVRRVRIGLLFAFVGVIALQMAAASARAWPPAGRETRTLPSGAGASIESLVRCLEEMAGPDAAGRILTVSEFGGYLTWRLPRYSRSIDGRTIFADSVAGPEAYHAAYGPPRPVGPYAAADLAILPLEFPTAAVLDTARGWRRIASATAHPVGGVPAGLWIRDGWPERAGAAADGRCRSTRQGG